MLLLHVRLYSGERPPRPSHEAAVRSPLLSENYKPVYWELTVVFCKARWFLIIVSISETLGACTGPTLPSASAKIFKRNSEIKWGHMIDVEGGVFRFLWFKILSSLPSYGLVCNLNANNSTCNFPPSVLTCQGEKARGKVFVATSLSARWFNNQHLCRCTQEHQEGSCFLRQTSHAVLAAHTHNGHKIALNNQNTQRHFSPSPPSPSDWK